MCLDVIEVQGLRHRYHTQKWPISQMPLLRSTRPPNSQKIRTPGGLSVSSVPACLSNVDLVHNAVLLEGGTQLLLLHHLHRDLCRIIL